MTCYFNPNCYASKRRNYFVFRESLRVSGIPCLTVECHESGVESDLTGFPDVRMIVSQDVMWQKERLVNLAIERLPKEWTKLAWLDCDILFENCDWAIEAVKRLDNCSVVQLFSEVERLPSGRLWGREGQKRWAGFAAAKADRGRLPLGTRTRHGLTGFAWAAHRDIVERHGLYDSCIAGGGDHLMAHAFAGDWNNTCVNRVLGGQTSRRLNFAAWARAVDESVRGRLSYVPGAVFHLWHGDISNRLYEARHDELTRLEFDPETDLRIGESGCWEWASDKPELHLWVKQYFEARKEDQEATHIG